MNILSTPDNIAGRTAGGVARALKSMQNACSQLRTGGAYRDTATYAIGYLVVAAVNFLLLPFYTKALPQHEVGLIGLLLVAVPLIRHVVRLGADTAFCIRFYRLDESGRAQGLYNSFLPMAFMLLLLAAAMTAGRGLIESVLGVYIGAGHILLLMATVAAVELAEYYLLVLRYEKRPIAFAVGSAGRAVILAFGAVMLVHFVVKDERAYLYALLLSSGLVGIAGVCHFLKRYRVSSFRPSLSVVGSLLALGMPLVPTAIISAVLSGGDRFVVHHFKGVEAVAVYSLGYTLAQGMLSMILLPLSRSFGPAALQAAGVDLQGCRDLMLRTFVWSSAILGCMVVVASAVLPELFAIVFDEAYSQALPVFWVLVIALAAKGLATTVLGYAFYVRERTGMMALFIGAAAVLNIGLNILLVPHYSIMGAGVGTLLAGLFLLVTFGIAAQRLLQFSFPFGFTVFLFAMLSLAVIMHRLVEKMLSVPVTAALVKFVVAVACAVFMWVTTREVLKGKRDAGR